MVPGFDKSQPSKLIRDALTPTLSSSLKTELSNVQSEILWQLSGPLADFTCHLHEGPTTTDLKCWITQTTCSLKNPRTHPMHAPPSCSTTFPSTNPPPATTAGTSASPRLTSTAAASTHSRNSTRGACRSGSPASFTPPFVSTKLSLSLFRAAPVSTVDEIS